MPLGARPSSLGRQEPMVTELLTRRAQVDAVGADGSHALLVASAPLVRLLCAWRATVDAAPRGTTALSAACAQDALAVEALLSCRADPEHGEPKPLLAAVLARNERAVELLLQASADVNVGVVGRATEVGICRRLLAARAELNGGREGDCWPLLEGLRRYFWALRVVFGPSLA